uniref:Nuclear hormone receptor family member nhr-98 n=4 Tax=Caenorhabditis elegans TaxID=6239 RepID=NHR98_CAEEL|nr:RecName: Full=Nuclear hormone receptor family member nhr-98 [Caenorhabditis elegans]
MSAAARTFISIHIGVCFDEMDSPGSSAPSPPDLTIIPKISSKKCQICENPAHGKHFGAVTCRACAAFFRRFGISNNFKPCKTENKCSFRKNGYFSCKKCRMQRCLQFGMTIDNFQFDREPFNPLKMNVGIPQTVDTFSGRPSLILFSAPSGSSGPKRYIDVQFLVDRAVEVLLNGSETPYQVSNVLQKLAIGLQNIRGPQQKVSQIVTKIGKEGIFKLWEEEMLRMAKWLTYFDDFQRLPHSVQIEILNGVWFLFGRLENIASTALARKRKLCKDDMVMTCVNKNVLICDLRTLEIDLSWCSKYTFQQLKFFDQYDDLRQLDILINAMLDLEPTHEELSYMICQLCFHQVGKKLQGNILKTVEKLQEVLSNNLHDYYVNQMNQPKYSKRIARMMKINNTVEQCLYRDRVKADLMKVFEVFHVECSHPGIFLNA